MPLYQRVWVNFTQEGRLIGLVEEGAVIRLSAPLPLDRQTILTIERNDDETMYLPARVVRSFVRADGATGRTEHYLALEFLEPLATVGPFTDAPRSIHVAHA